MRKICLSLIAFGIMVAGCTSKTVSSDEISESTEQVTNDSIGKWFLKNYSKWQFFISDDKIKAGELNDSIVIAFIENIHPKIQKFYSENLDDVDSYKNIESYIGTDGKEWIVYDKFRSNVNGSGKIQLFRFDTTSSEDCMFCTDKEYPTSWVDIVSTFTGQPAPTPSELDNVIFNNPKSRIYYEKDDSLFHSTQSDKSFKYINGILNIG